MCETLGAQPGTDDTDHCTGIDNSSCYDDAQRSMSLLQHRVQNGTWHPRGCLSSRYLMPVWMARPGSLSLVPSPGLPCLDGSHLPTPSRLPLQGTVSSWRATPALVSVLWLLVYPPPISPTQGWTQH